VSKRITITYEDVWWESDEPDTEPTIDHGYYIPFGRFHSSVVDVWGDELNAIIDIAIIDIAFEIECEHCADYLFWNGHLWVDQNGEAGGVNSFSGFVHVHWPEEMPVEKLERYAREFGCIYFNGDWFSSEHHTIDYRNGIERSYSIHPFDCDWTDEELNSLKGEYYG
jgi:hypothetical protein